MIKIIFFAVVLAGLFTASAVYAQTVCQVFQGCTGASSFTTDALLRGNGTGALQVSGVTIDSSDNLTSSADAQFDQIGLGSAAVASRSLHFGRTFTAGGGTIGMGLSLGDDITAASGQDIYGAYFSNVFTKSGGTHNIFANAYIDRFTINGASGTVTNAAGLYIENSPLGGTNNYALFVDAGDTRIDGSLILTPIATPTTDVDGEIAVDIDAWATGRDAIEFYDGTASTYIIGALASDTPNNGEVLKWNTGGTITWETDETAAGSGDAVTVNSTGADSTANFLDNIYLDFDIADGGAGGPDDVTAKFEYAQTLAGNPAFAVGEFGLYTDGASAYGFIAEGSTADTNEFLILFPLANPADTTNYFALGASDGDALAGDSATSFFDAGAIEAVRGGTGGDSSGSTGLARVDAGTWSYAELSGDVSTSGSNVVTVADDSHNHVITNIDAFTETELETQLSDVTALFTNNVTGDVTVSGGTSAITAGVIVEDDLTGTLTFDATDFLDLSGIDSSTTSEGLKLPQHATACATGFSEGQVCWEADANILHIGNAAAFENFIPASGFSGEATVSATGAVTLADSVTVTGWDLGASVATTPAADDSDTSIATTAYVQGEINGAGGTNLTCSSGVCNVDDAFLLLAGDTSSGNYTLTGDWDFGGGGIEIENGTTPPACTVGQLYLDTDATSGQRLMACEGGTFVVQGDGGGAETNSLEVTITGVLDTEIFIGTGANTGNFVAVSGDATLANTGVLTIGSDKILESMMKAVNAAVDEDILTYESTTGDWEYHTPSELITAGNYISWTGATLNVAAADLTTVGAVELATAAETTTGTDATRAVTPDGLAGSDYGIRYVEFIIFDFTTDNATGDGKFYWHVPAGLDNYNLVEVHAEVITAGTTGTEDIQIHNVDNALDMLSTKITIDSTETGSDTAATAAVINTSNDHINENDVVRIDVDAVQTTAAKGLIVTLGFQAP